jgi:hypothetical protein
MPEQPEAYQRLADLLPVGLYETPLAVGQPGLVPGAGATLLRLRLEGGWVLDIPMTKEARAGLARLAQAWTSEPVRRNVR